MTITLPPQPSWGGGPTPQAGASGVLPVVAVAQARAGVGQARATLAAAQGLWVGAQTGELAQAFTEVMSLVVLAQAAAVELMVEIDQRGVVADSTATDVGAWARVACANAGVALPAVSAAGLRTVVEAGRSPVNADVREALVRGRVPLVTAAALVKELAAIQVSVPASVSAAAREPVIAYAADGASARQLAQLREAVIANYGEEGDFDARTAAAHARREVTWGRKTADEMYTGTYTLDNEAYAVFHAALSALSAPVPDEDGAADRRTGGQRRADALIEVCSMVATDASWVGHARPAVAVRAQVVVTMGLADLVARTGYGLDSSGQPISAEGVRRLACDGAIIPMVLGSKGQPLDVGLASRTATSAQVHALRQRDRGCTFPGCERPASWCQAHHLVHWVDGGPTALWNLALLCERHHTLVHQHGYIGEVTDDGVRWRPPEGPPRIRRRSVPTSRLRQ